jgi:hypothetical protein
MSNNMIDGREDMPDMGGAMPSGSMDNSAGNSGNDMPAGGGEMPTGNMTGSGSNMGEKPAAGAGDMPAGNMLGTGGTSGASGNLSNDPVAGEMPSGSMHEGTSGKSTQQGQSSSNQSQPFELPGTLKIQLVPVSN